MLGNRTWKTIGLLALVTLAGLGIRFAGAAPQASAPAASDGRGGFLIRFGMDGAENVDWSGSMSPAPSRVTSWQFDQRDPLAELGFLLLCTSLGLGLVLAVRQFWLPGFFRTWSFTVHRSLSRHGILLAKSLAAAAALAVGVGGCGPSCSTSQRDRSF